VLTFADTVSLMISIIIQILSRKEEFNCKISSEIFHLMSGSEAGWPAVITNHYRNAEFMDCDRVHILILRLATRRGVPSLVAWFSARRGAEWSGEIPEKDFLKTVHFGTCFFTGTTTQTFTMLISIYSESDVSFSKFLVIPCLRDAVSHSFISPPSKSYILPISNTANSQDLQSS